MCNVSACDKLLVLFYEEGDGIQISKILINLLKY